MSEFMEIKPGKKIFKRAYVSIMLWFVGRAVQSASRVDKAVKDEFQELPDGYTFSLGVAPKGPAMIIRKTDTGKIKYLGSDIEKHNPDLKLVIKNIEAAFLLFTFQESTPVSFARDRIIADGDLPPACAVVRILDIVQVYLLPGIIAKMAIKRYPVWSFIRKLNGRTRIYVRTILGY